MKKYDKVIKAKQVSTSDIKKETAEQEKTNFKAELFSEAVVKNPVLVSTIGLCPVVAICTTLKSAVLLSAITYLTMIFTQVLTASLLKHFPQWTRVALYTLSGMAIVAPSMLFMQHILPEDMIALGIYLPLLAINPLITRQCERVAVKSSVRHAFVNAVCSATGYSAVLIITGFIREFFGSGMLWGYKLFSLPPATALTNPFGGFIIIGFMAAVLRLYFKKIDPQYAEELAIHSRSSIKKPRNNKIKNAEKKLDENEPKRLNLNQETLAGQSEVEEVKKDDKTKNINNNDEEEKITKGDDLEAVESIELGTEQLEQASQDENLDISPKTENEKQEKTTDIQNSQLRKKIEYTSKELEELMNRSLDDIISDATDKEPSASDVGGEVSDE